MLHGFSARAKISEMPLQESDCAVTYKVLIIGDHAVGKTSLLSSLTNRGFQERVLPTVGVDFVTRIFEVDGALIQLQIWDCSGLERFRSITNRQFKGVQGLVLVYDVTNEMSFKSLKHWLKSINIEHENRKNSYEPTPVVLCGNKCDRICDKKVSRVKGEKFADRQMMFGFFETSAKTGENVYEAFHRLAYHITDIEHPKLMTAYHPYLIRRTSKLTPYKPPPLRQFNKKKKRRKEAGAPVVKTARPQQTDIVRHGSDFTTNGLVFPYDGRQGLTQNGGLPEDARKRKKSHKKNCLLWNSCFGRKRK